MADNKKEVTKTVNRTGKKLVEKALVMGAKKKVEIDKEKIKKLNEDKVKAKLEVQEADVDKVSGEKTEKVIKEEKYELTIGLKEMLKEGCHLGHKVAKTHPKARINIYMAKDGVEIIDLVKTKEALAKACNFLHNARKAGKQIVMVGTKRQAREVVKRVAIEIGVGYVTDRWLGGTITNWEQIRGDIRKLNKFKENEQKGISATATKKEQSETKKEMIRLEKMIGGLTKLDKMFDIIFVVDAGFEKTAVREAQIRGVTVVAMTDTDSDPTKVNFAIPVNDDNVKSVNLIVEEIGRAIK
jgi:small subunit ribosomal protein S2